MATRRFDSTFNRTTPEQIAGKGNPMPDHDVTLQFTIPDLERDAADEFVDEVACYILARTGWNVASRVVESHPSTDNPRRDT